MKITNIKSYIFEYPIKNSVVTSFGEMKLRPALIIGYNTNKLIASKKPAINVNNVKNIIPHLKCLKR